VVPGVSVYVTVVRGSRPVVEAERDPLRQRQFICWGWLDFMIRRAG
jgi:hypothetical protein